MTILIDEALEKELRRKVVNEAKTWLWTPSQHLGTVKGPRGGCDCATFVSECFKSIQYDSTVQNYNPQWFLHKSAELYLDEVVKLWDEVLGPPDRMPKLADLILYKIGRTYSHGAIVLEWPHVIHLNPVSGYVSIDDGDRAPFFSSRSRRHFTGRGWR